MQIGEIMDSRKVKLSDALTNANEVPKRQHQHRFQCDYPNCSKSFTRKDHLKRHRLNHDESAVLYECEKFEMKFKRADVKKDHYNRHLQNQQKGEEAMNRPHHVEPIVNN